MGSKLSAKAQLKLDTLTEARRKWERVYGLVEQYGGARTGDDTLLSQLSRTAADVSRLFMNNGYGIMADHANQVAMMAKGSAGKQTKLRTMRELIGSVKAAIEHAEKMIVTEDKEEETGASE